MIDAVKRLLFEYRASKPSYQIKFLDFTGTINKISSKYKQSIDCCSAKSVNMWVVCLLQLHIHKQEYVCQRKGPSFIHNNVLRRFPLFFRFSLI